MYFITKIFLYEAILQGMDNSVECLSLEEKPAFSSGHRKLITIHFLRNYFFCLPLANRKRYQ